MSGAGYRSLVYRPVMSHTESGGAIADSALPTLVGNIGIGTWRWDPADGSVAWDSAAESVYGMEPGSFPGTFEAFIGRIHPEDRDEAMETITTIATTGGDYSIRHRVVHPDGEIRWVEGQGRVVLNDAGEPAAGYGVVYDVTDRYTVELERSQLLQKEAKVREELRFLIEASDTLTGTLNTRRVAERLADLLVPRLAQSCVIDVKHDTPIGWLLTCVKSADMPEPRFRSGSPTSLKHAANRMADHVDQSASTHGASNLTTDIVDVTFPPVGAEFVKKVRLTSHGTDLGLVSIITDPKKPPPGNDDGLLEAVCSRAAVALAHAELYADRSRFISIFQTTDTLAAPSIDGLDIGVHYRPATDLVRLSGDLYDAFELADGSWIVAVGDVCGKGAVAAGHAELCRSALRASAFSQSDIVSTLDVLNRVLITDRSRPMLTISLLHFRFEGDMPTITAAAAGHPPPILANSTAWRALDVSGTMLGVTDEPQFTTETLNLAHDESITMYTDGVIDARFGEAFYGTDRLGELLRSAAFGPADGIASDVGHAVDTWATGNPVDDVLVLVVKADTKP